MLCKTLSIPFLDDLAALNSNGTADMLYFKGDLIHPNAKGHQIIGTTLADFIANSFNVIK
jgi:lysophospholipase L1-like esterase